VIIEGWYRGWYIPTALEQQTRYIIRQYQEAWLEIGQCFSDSRFYLLLRFYWCFICWPVANISSNFGSSLLCFIRREPGGSYGDGLANFGFDFFFELFFWYFHSSFFGICLLSAFVWVWQREVLFSFKSGRMLRSGQILFDYFFGELFLIQNFSPKIARAWRPAVFSLSVYFLFSRSSFSLFIFLLFLFSMEETFRKGILVPSFSVVFCRFDKDDSFWTWW